MAKLYFRYGAVGSAKTMNLIAVAHNYQQQKKRVFLIKPALDDRFGKEQIRSRAGLEKQADLLLAADQRIDRAMVAGMNCVLVDEVQFLTPTQIDELRDIATTLDVPVICYGLRADFRTRLFPGARRLLELADSIEEVKTTCAFCNRKGIFNLRLRDGQPSLDGPVVELGTEDKYQPACPRCYHERLGRWGDPGAPAA